MNVHRGDDEVKAIIAGCERFSEQIDKIAVARGWFRPGLYGWPTQTTLNAYLCGDLTVHEAVEQLAMPIEKAFAKALHTRPGREDTSNRSTECGLWDLWYGVLHAAKQSPWDDGGNGDQDKLLELLRTFKARPDPSSLETLSPHLANDWVHKDRKLWSVLKLIGPSARETWNDAPGCGADCTEPEVEAWCNVNAFVARMTLAGIRDIWLYGMWAMRDAAEPQHWAEAVVDEQGVRVDFRVALVWLKVAGREMWRRCCDGEPAAEVHVGINVDSKGSLWYGDEDFSNAKFSRARWSYWKRRFECVIESQDKKMCGKNKQFAQEARAIMEVLEKGVVPGDQKRGLESCNEACIKEA